MGPIKQKPYFHFVAATNCPWDIDSGILRSGRFGERIGIPLPDADARRYILKRNFDGLPMDEGDYSNEAITKNDIYSVLRNFTSSVGRGM